LTRYSGQLAGSFLNTNTVKETIMCKTTETLRAVKPEDYLTHDCLMGGDYGGLGYIAHVNVGELVKLAEESEEKIKDTVASCGMNSWSLRDCVEECNSVGFPPSLIISEGGYNSITAYVHPDWAEGVEIIEGLEYYPVVCDEALSEREMELEDEQWESCTRHDLVTDILKGVTNAERHDAIEILLDDDELDLRGQFHAACELHNVYPQFEGGGDVYYHGMDDITDTLRDFLLIETDDSPAASAFRAARDGLMGELDLQLTKEVN
jgi:hypothetical protein